MHVVYNPDMTVEDIVNVLARMRKEAQIDVRDATAYGSPNAVRCAYHDLHTIEDIMTKLGMLVDDYE